MQKINLNLKSKGSLRDGSVPVNDIQLLRNCASQISSIPLDKKIYNPNCKFRTVEEPVLVSYIKKDTTLQESYVTNNYSITKNAITLRKKSLSKSIGSLTYIPKRFVFTLLAFLGLCNAFAMRVNLNFAMVAMVRQPTISSVDSTSKIAEACPEFMNTNNRSLNGNSSTTIYRGEFDWDSKLQQLALASFYFPYGVAQIPAGILAEKYHAKHFYGFGILITSLSTLLIPVAARLSVQLLIVIRIFQGCAQAAVFPAISTLISRWSPVMERSRISSIIYNGTTVGVVISFALSGLLCDSNFLGGWPSAFYVFGASGCLWFVFWTCLVSESPELHSQISKAELIIIQNGQESSKSISTPWKCILTSLPVWALILATIGFVWGDLIIILETPTYLNNVFHFDLKENGFLSALPNIVSVLMGLFAGYIADKLREWGKLHINSIRKIITSIGFYGSGLCLILVLFAKCSSTVAILCLTLVSGFINVAFSGLFATFLDMSPEFAGTLMALGNGIGSNVGFIIPIFIGWVTSDGNSMKNWGIIFVTTFAILVFCGTVFNIIGSAEIQVWQTSEIKPEKCKAITSSHHTEAPLNSALKDVPDFARLGIEG